MPFRASVYQTEMRCVRVEVVEEQGESNGNFNILIWLQRTRVYQMYQLLNALLKGQ